MKILYFLTFLLFSSISFASLISIKSYCDKLKVGQPYQIDMEEKALISKGFKTEIAVAFEEGHNTRMLKISHEGSKQKCDVGVRDGNIFKLYQ